MYNKVILQGNCTRDIELKYTQAGKAVANTGIAVNRRWKDASGQQKEEAMFVDLTFWGKTAEIANQYLQKGSKILIDGSLVFQTWTDTQGQKRSKHSINVENLQMLDTKKGNQNNNTQPNQGQQSNYGSQQPNQGGYGQPQHTQYRQPQPNYNAPQGQQRPPQAPEIDIDKMSNLEIPF